MVLRIITDSTSDIEPAVARDLNIEIVPLSVRFGETSYRDSVDLSATEFYELLAVAETLPQTSAPAPGAYLELFDRHTQAGDELICITVSAKLSGSFNSAHAARGLARAPELIKIFDSRSATAAEATIVIRAAQLVKHGAPIEAVLAAAESTRDRQDLLVGLETLDYLQRGGRIGRASAFMGGLLNVKPILTLRDGEVAPSERVRSRSRMIARLEEFALAFPDPLMIRVAHAAVPDEAEALAARIQSVRPGADVSVAWMGPVIGVYTGPGAIGVAVVPGDSI